jgi:uncharacterized membrane protein
VRRHEIVEKLVIIERLAIEGEELPGARYSTALLLGEDLVTEDKLFENLPHVFYIGGLATSATCMRVSLAAQVALAGALRSLLKPSLLKRTHASCVRRKLYFRVSRCSLKRLAMNTKDLLTVATLITIILFASVNSYAIQITSVDLRHIESLDGEVPVRIWKMDIVNPAPVGEYVPLYVYVFNYADSQEKVDVSINSEPPLEIKPSSSFTLIVPGKRFLTIGYDAAKFLVKAYSPGDYVITVRLLYKGLMVGEVPITVTFSKKVKLSIKIVDRFDGSPVSDATVCIWSISGGEYCTYKAMPVAPGIYELMIPAGEYYLELRHEDFPVYKYQWVINIAEDTYLTFQIDAGGFLKYILLLALILAGAIFSLYMLYMRLSSKAERPRREEYEKTLEDMKKLREDYTKGGITFEDLVRRVWAIVGPNIENVARSINSFREWLEQNISGNRDVSGFEALAQLKDKVEGPLMSLENYFGDVERYKEVMEEVSIWVEKLNYKGREKLTKEELVKLMESAKLWQVDCENLHYEWARKCVNASSAT